MVLNGAKNGIITFLHQIIKKLSFLAFIIPTVAKKELLTDVKAGSNYVSRKWSIRNFHWSKDLDFLSFHIRLYIT